MNHIIPNGGKAFVKGDGGEYGGVRNLCGVPGTLSVL